MPSSALALHVDARDVQKLYADLRAAGSHLTVDLRRGVRSAAKPMQDAVKTSASWSSRIPGAVQTKVSLSARNPSVAITVNAKKAPEAAPLNNGGKSGQFRHPVFGHMEVWVPQNAHPFFDQATRSATGRCDAAMLQVLDDIAHQAGFR